MWCDKKLSQTDMVKVWWKREKVMETSKLLRQEEIGADERRSEGDVAEGRADFEWSGERPRERVCMCVRVGRAERSDEESDGRDRQ